jgi:hypothetical protein
MNDDNERTYGVWGGKVGGWCLIRLGPIINTERDRCTGTLTEATKVCQTMQREHFDYTYEVLRFDETRDPTGIWKRPTDAQRQLLERVELIGDYEMLGASHSLSMVKCIIDYGWITGAFDDRRWRLTKMGRAVLEDCRRVAL